MYKIDIHTHILPENLNELTGRFSDSRFLKLEPIDDFSLEYVSDPHISPDGKKILYVRNFKDIMTDKNFSNLWMINFNGTNNTPITTGNKNDFSPIWSISGKNFIY